jgi:hypothetical protein
MRDEFADLVALRAALERRVDDCWDRLQDAALELAQVHEVPVEEIFDSIRLGLAAGDGSDTRTSG